MAMTDSEYHQLADEMFTALEDAIENAIDEQDADIDIDASGNVLQLEFQDKSKIVINKQEPLHQIWVATQFGGYHFSYVEGKWLDERGDAGEFMPFVLASILRQGGIELTL
ncbi:iron donor protein CyaY [Shewanella insulae]|uniref:Iron-sulfur cluster assembly protein CyaY n=1 Tax=Shewanella insulae TaxID=2681496 RepID=A0A6L7I6E4_9GAMM|nr:iron donor protein CyaY [Shewanella insulae]MCG9713158.1 iron donor protein CyaY [Shewanella insulae]MCG9740342.1 iron donor protein CyaY [Shewanella insulae]MCG9757170.1 iron donor protein CyaY [Shewanella insulae]MXR70971.1 iron donor protein CyaY [Shewanella insulae]